MGVPYDPVSTEEALDRIESFFSDDNQHVVVHLSLPTLMLARRRRYMRLLLEEADLILPSGKYVRWAAATLKRSQSEMTDPSVFLKLLMSRTVELSKSVYLFGGKGTTVERAYQNLKREIPRLFVVGRHREDYPRIEHDRVVQAIGKASPDFLLIGKGTPREENWYLNNREKLNAKVTVFVGLLFDVLAGNARGAYNRGIPNPQMKREIPQPGTIRRLWWTPIFVSAVVIQRLFWKKTPVTR
jgi:N-acetylglucosaminyldiphosphoundecaprenol N-acetyl-beta-D-mannosaminyltransferase